MVKCHWTAFRHVGAAAENLPKTRKKCFWLGTRRGFYLSPTWTVWAEILWDSSQILGLPCVQISLDSIKACRSSIRKRGENCPKNQVKRGQKSWNFGVVFWGVTRLRTTFWGVIHQNMASPKNRAFVQHIFLYISRYRTLHIGASIGAGSLKQWKKNFTKT